MNSQPVRIQSGKLVKGGFGVFFLVLAALALTDSISGGDDFNVIGADGHRIKLENNSEARNPSWQELQDFLLDDPTDRILYDRDSFACADYAEKLHNAAFVVVDLGQEFRTDPTEKVSLYRSERPTTAPTEEPRQTFATRRLHALNAFRTTDMGLVFIDSTGLRKGERGPASMDAKVDVEIGEEYVLQHIFPDPGWIPVYGSMGKLEKIEVTW